MRCNKLKSVFHRLHFQYIHVKDTFLQFHRAVLIFRSKWVEVSFHIVENSEKDVVEPRNLILLKSIGPYFQILRDHHSVQELSVL